MNISALILSLSGAVTGLVTGALLVPHVLRQIAGSVSKGNLAAMITSFIGTGGIIDPVKDQLLSTGNTEALLPFIEKQIDDFLRNRLKIAIPMIGSLIGERTITQLKEVFMKELESILPQVIEQYVGSMGGKIDLEKIINSKLQAIPAAKIEAFMRPTVMRLLLITGGMAGLGAGLVNTFIVETFFLG